MITIFIKRFPFCTISTSSASSSKIDHMEIVKKNLAPYQAKLLSHPIYNSIKSDKQVRVFMENHVFAVFDFMSLLKSLQRECTCVSVPWTPTRLGEISRFLNEIVVGEESDKVLGVTLSHYEMYLKAMEEVGADGKQVEKFVQTLRSSNNIPLALSQVQSSRVSPHTLAFVQDTFKLTKEGKIHEIASSFFFGREDPIPQMFQRILDNFSQSQLKYPWLEVYLERHVEVDSGEHGPLAEKLMHLLCQEDEKKWLEAENAAKQAIVARIQLWDGILEKVNSL